MYQEIKHFNERLLTLVDVIEQQNILALSDSHLPCHSDCHDRVAVICQNIKAIVCLNASDLQFYNSAKIICRALFEASAKVGWMLNPLSNPEKVNRWLALVKEAERKLIEQKADSQLAESDNEYFTQERIDELTAVISQVTARVKVEKPSIKLLNGLPPFNQILEDLDVGFMYMMYREMSNETHASHLSSSTYSPNYGLNEAGVIWQWWNIYSLSYFSLLIGARAYLCEILGDGAILSEQDHTIESDIRRIRELADRLTIPS